MTSPELSSPAKPRIGRPPSLKNPREQILAAAARLFANKGFDGASLNDLSAAMGLSKPAIYNYFASKQALYDAIIVTTLGRLAQASQASFDKTASPAAQVRAFMRAHARCFEENHDGFLTTLVGFSGMDRDLRREALAHRAAHEGLLRSIIANGVASGAFRKVEPETTARAALSMLNWMARWFRPGAAKPAEAFAEEYFDLLFRGIQAPD